MTADLAPCMADLSTARTARPGAAAPGLSDANIVSMLKSMRGTVAEPMTHKALDNDVLAVFGADEFRFREFGVDRK